jgi:hypothetical protein
MMMKPEDVYDAIEGSHPGQLETGSQDDLAIHEQVQADEVLQLQLEKSQALDQYLADVFVDVPVHAGLQEQLHQAIDSVVAIQGMVPDECFQPEQGGSADESIDTAASKNSTAGQLLRWGALAATLLIAVTIWRQFSPADPLSSDLLVAQASDWTGQVLAAGRAWNTGVDNVPGTYPMDTHVMPPVQRWTRLKTSSDPRAVVYDLSSVKTGRLLLFVVRSGQSYQLPQVALQELAGSGPLTVGAWQHGDLLYVMVGRRNGPPLQQYIRQRLLGYHWRAMRPAV